MNRERPRSPLIFAPIRISLCRVDGTQLTPYSGMSIGRSPVTVSFRADQRLHQLSARTPSTSGSCGATRPRNPRPITESTYLDQERNLMFNLRSAFVQTLQAKAVLENAQENLAYWDQELDVNRTRFKAGDLAQVDLDRLELQRVQFESDYETAMVNLRTAKIQLLMLLNDRTPIEQFDVTGPFDFSDELKPLEEFRNIALGAAAGSEGCRAERGPGEDQLPARGCQRLDRSDLQRVVDAQPFVQQPVRLQHDRRQRQHSSAHLRPQSGREGAHQDRHRPQRAIAGRRRGAGLQRRRFGLRTRWSAT